jgi:hypothetical protein
MGVCNMKKDIITVDLAFNIKYSRLDNSIKIKLYEVFNKSALFSAMVYEKVIKIRFWDNEKTIKKKIKKAKALLLYKYFKQHKRDDKIFNICKELAGEDLIPANEIKINYQENHERSKKEDQDNVLNLKDFIEKRTQ